MRFTFSTLSFLPIFPLYDKVEIKAQKTPLQIWIKLHGKKGVKN